MSARLTEFARRALRLRRDGGRIRPGVSDGTCAAMLSPGREITDPDEAEAMGLTADARRMRDLIDQEAPQR